MNILDEQIVENQRQLLKSWRITRRLLRHSEFDTVAKRMGKVIRVSSMGLTVWSPRAEREVFFDWPR